MTLPNHISTWEDATSFSRWRDFAFGWIFCYYAYSAPLCVRGLSGLASSLGIKVFSLEKNICFFRKDKQYLPVVVGYRVVAIKVA
jgi:hypothetical protein